MSEIKFLSFFFFSLLIFFLFVCFYDFDHTFYCNWCALLQTPFLVLLMSRCSKKVCVPEGRKAQEAGRIRNWVGALIIESWKIQKLYNPKPRRATQKLKQSTTKSKSSNQEKQQQKNHTTRWRGRNGQTDEVMWEHTDYIHTRADDQQHTGEFTQSNTRHMRAKLQSVTGNYINNQKCDSIPYIHSLID